MRAATLIGAVMAVLLGPVSSAWASCAEVSETDLWAQAEVVFEGQALDGPVSSGTLLSPARFEVIEYLKGDGPDVVEVSTAVSEAGDGVYQHLSVGITPSPGQVWRIYADHVDDWSLATSICSGSEYLYDQQLAEAPPGDTPSPGTGADDSRGLIVALLGLVGAGAVGAVAVQRRAARGEPPRHEV